MCIILNEQGESQGKQRWWGAVSQRQQWISREAEAEVPSPGETGDPAWDGWPCVVPAAAGTGHWDVLQGSEWTPRCHKHQVQGGRTRPVGTRLESFVDSVPHPLGQCSTASTISLSFFACKPLSPSWYVFPVSSMNEMGPVGWKESLVETKL